MLMNGFVLTWSWQPSAVHNFMISGFVTLGGEPGGTFSLELPLVKQPFWWYGLACRIFGEFACSVVGDLLRVKKKN